MFGAYNLPATIELEDTILTIKKDGNKVIYTREQGEEKIEKILITTSDKIILNPTEPVWLPKQITPNFLIEFSRPITVGPKVKEKVYITIPVESGVFINQNEESELLDVFSLEKPKYTLYGEVKNGVVCRYWKSEIYNSVPSLDPLHQACIALSIQNKSQKWFSVTKAVFSAYGMKIYFTKDLVAMIARMEITGEGNAVTDFRDQPLRKNMTKAYEMFSAKMLPGLVSKFIMEGGL